VLVIPSGGDPAELRFEALEASPTNPEVDALLSLCVIGVAIAAAFFMGLLPLREAFAVVTNAGKT